MAKSVKAPAAGAAKTESKAAAKSATTVTVRPIDDRVLVLPDKADEMTAGGILLPGNAQERPSRGTVLAVGPGRLLKDGKRAPVAVKAGDTVVYGEYSGTGIKIGGVDHKIVRESDLLGRLE